MPDETTYATGSGSASAVLESDERPSSGFDVRTLQQAVVLAFGRRTNVKQQPTVLMQDAIVVVADMLEADVSGVAEVLPDGARLSLKIASHGSNASKVRPVVYELPLSAGVLAGYALNVASSVVTPNLAAEKRFTDPTLRKLGVHSALSLPLHLNAQPFGALNVYRQDDRAFTGSDVEFAEMIAHLLVSSIARVKAEEALQEQSAFTATVLDTVGAVVMVLDAEGNLVSLNRACEQMTGFTTERVRGRSFCSVFAISEELGFVQTMFQRAVDGAGEQHFESFLLTKDGLRRRIAWSLQAVHNGDHSGKSIVLTGLDRTEQLETLAQLQDAKAAAEKSAQLLSELRASVQAGSHAAAEDPVEHSGGPSCDAVVPQPDPLLVQPFQARGNPKGPERRTSPRRAYQYRQRVAPMRGGLMPAAEQFLDVVCEDISAGGFSFCLKRAPTFSKLVAALGKPPAIVYFTADVVAVRKKEVQGAEVFLVGCRFTGRVNIESESVAHGDLWRRL